MKIMSTPKRILGTIIPPRIDDFPRDGVLLPFGNYRGYSDDLSPLAAEYGHRGCVFKDRFRINIADPHLHEAIDFIQDCPTSKQFAQRFGSQAEILLQRLKQDGIVYETNTFEQAVDAFGHFHLESPVQRTGAPAPLPTQRITVLHEAVEVKVHEITMRMLDFISKQPTRVNAYYALSNVVGMDKHRSSLPMIISDIGILIRAKKARLLALPSHDEAVYLRHDPDYDNPLEKPQSRSIQDLAVATLGDMVGGGVDLIVNGFRWGFTPTAEQRSRIEAREASQHKESGWEMAPADMSLLESYVPGGDTTWSPFWMDLLDGFDLGDLF